MQTYLNSEVITSNPFADRVPPNVIDGKCNYRLVGETTRDATDLFVLIWKIDIVVSYTVVAAFHGSQSYYGT